MAAAHSSPPLLLLLFARAALARLGDAPAPALEAGWWLRAAGLRTISPRCNGLSAPDLLKFVDAQHAAGVKALAINAVYDSGSGYRQRGPSGPGNLWCGLAINDFMRVSPDIGTVDDWTRLERAVHSKGMALVSWMNPSYFWTGSKYFKQAEEDIRTYGLNGLPSESPALWFKWRPNCTGVSVDKPADDAPRDNNGDIHWVCDRALGVAYLSIFADQPSADFGSEPWQRQLRRMLEHWIVVRKVDGFVFDWPDGYFSAGIKSYGLWKYNRSDHLIKRVLTDVVRELSRGRAASFAELYGQPERAMDYGLEGSLDARVDYERADVVVRAIKSGNATDSERAFTGEGGLDEQVQLCYRHGWCGVLKQRQAPMTSWFPEADDDGPWTKFNAYNCYGGHGTDYASASKGHMPLERCFSVCRLDPRCESVTVKFLHARDGEGRSLVDCSLRGHITVSQCDRNQSEAYATFHMDAPYLTRLVRAVGSAGGYLATLEASADSQWWSTVSWPGSEGPALAQQERAFEGLPAFSRAALRLPLGTRPASGRQYALLRYDARRGRGHAAIAVFNYGREPANVTVVLPAGLRAAFGQAPSVFSSWEARVGRGAAPADAALSPAFGVHAPPLGFVLAGGLRLPSWARLQNAAGNRELDCGEGHGAAAAWPKGRMSLGACFLECLGAGGACAGVTVSWLAAGLVDCGLRGALRAEHCTDGAAAERATFYPVP